MPLMTQSDIAISGINDRSRREVDSSTGRLLT